MAKKKSIRGKKSTKVEAVEIIPRIKPSDKRKERIRSLAGQQEEEIKSNLSLCLLERFQSELTEDVLARIADHLTKEGWRRLALRDTPTTTEGDSTGQDKWAQPLRVKVEELFNVVRCFSKDELVFRKLANWIASKTAMELGIPEGMVTEISHKERRGIDVIEQVLSQGGRLDQLFTFTNSLWTMWPRHATAEIHLGYHDIRNEQLNDKLTSFHDSEGASAILSYIQEQSKFGVKTRVRLSPPFGSGGRKIGRLSSDATLSQEVLVRDVVGAVISIGSPNSNEKTHDLAMDMWKQMADKDIALPFLVLRKNGANEALPKNISFFRCAENDEEESRFYAPSGESRVIQFERLDAQTNAVSLNDYGLIVIDAREAFCSWHGHSGQLKAIVAGIGYHATRACASAFGYVMDVLAGDVRDPRIITKDGFAIAAVEVEEPKKIDSSEGPFSIWNLDAQNVDDWSTKMGWRFFNLSRSN